MAEMELTANQQLAAHRANLAHARPAKAARGRAAKGAKRRRAGPRTAAKPLCFDESDEDEGDEELSDEELSSAGEEDEAPPRGPLAHKAKASRKQPRLASV